MPTWASSGELMGHRMCGQTSRVFLHQSHLDRCNTHEVAFRQSPHTDLRRIDFGFTIVVGLLLASDAQAQMMIFTADQWKTLPPEVKAGYSMGLVDGVLAGTMLPDKQDTVLALGLTGCIQETPLREP